MKRRIKILLLIGIMSLCSITSVLAYDTSDYAALWKKAQKFASRYDYHEGDEDISFSQYPSVNYTSGIERRADGSEYECPAIYIDAHAQMVNSYDLKKGELNIIINGQKSAYSGDSLLYNSTALVPAEIFDELGCMRSFDEDLYLTTISRNGTVLEIMPYLIGMRKNQASGFYVPLPACARFFDDKLYVPLRSIAEELGIQVDWDGDTHSVYLDNSIISAKY